MAEKTVTVKVEKIIKFEGAYCCDTCPQIHAGCKLISYEIRPFDPDALRHKRTAACLEVERKAKEKT